MIWKKQKKQKHDPSNGDSTFYRKKIKEIVNSNWWWLCFERESPFSDSKFQGTDRIDGRTKRICGNRWFYILSGILFSTMRSSFQWNYIVRQRYEIIQIVFFQIIIFISIIDNSTIRVINFISRDILIIFRPKGKFIDKRNNSPERKRARWNIIIKERKLRWIVDLYS